MNTAIIMIILATPIDSQKTTSAISLQMSKFRHVKVRHPSVLIL